LRVNLPSPIALTRWGEKQLVGKAWKHVQRESKSAIRSGGCGNVREPLVQAIGMFSRDSKRFVRVRVVHEGAGWETPDVDDELWVVRTLDEGFSGEGFSVGMFL
jgi:hypothetical protein